jgi:hypothetical protein
MTFHFSINFFFFMDDDDFFFSFNITVILTLFFTYLFTQQLQVLSYRHNDVTTTAALHSSLWLESSRSSTRSKAATTVSRVGLYARLYCKHQEVPLVTAAEAASVN